MDWWFFQFFISILLIIRVPSQFTNSVQFIQNKDLGYTKEQVILVKDAYMLNDQRQSFKDEA